MGLHGPEWAKGSDVCVRRDVGGPAASVYTEEAVPPSAARNQLRYTRNIFRTDIGVGRRRFCASGERARGGGGVFHLAGRSGGKVRASDDPQRPTQRVAAPGFHV